MRDKFRQRIETVQRKLAGVPRPYRQAVIKPPPEPKPKPEPEPPPIKLPDIFKKTVVINLDHRTDRMELAKNEFFRHGLHFTRISAVRPTTGTNHINRGALGCLLSHIKILKAAARTKIPNILICEDDIIFSEDFNMKVQPVLSDLKAMQWDIFFFGARQMAAPQKVTDHIYRVKSALTTHCYAVNQPAYETIIAKFEELNAPTDVLLNQSISHLKTFTAEPILAWQRMSHSDITEKHSDHWFLIGDEGKRFNISQHSGGIEELNVKGIPKILHQIWLGSNVPPAFLKFREEWGNKHPDWSMPLWRDNNLPCLLNQSLFDSASNYGEKSDILRYELVHKYGGIYVDMDFECLRPIDQLLERKNLVVDECELMNGEYVIKAGAGIFGAVANHPFIEYVTKTLHDTYSINSNLNTPHRTGPYFFDNCFRDFYKDSIPSDVGTLPGKLFYPYSWQNSEDRTGDQLCHSKMFHKNSCDPDTYAIHHYAKSWQG